MKLITLFINRYYFAFYESLERKKDQMLYMQTDDFET